MYLHRRYHAPFIYILEPKTCSQQRPSWLSWQSVALDSRGVVSSILTEDLGVAFFATCLG